MPFDEANFNGYGGGHGGDKRHEDLGGVADAMLQAALLTALANNRCPSCTLLVMAVKAVVAASVLVIPPERHEESPEDQVPPAVMRLFGVVVADMITAYKENQGKLDSVFEMLEEAKTILKDADEGNLYYGDEDE